MVWQKVKPVKPGKTGQPITLLNLHPPQAVFSWRFSVVRFSIAPRAFDCYNTLSSSAFSLARPARGARGFGPSLHLVIHIAGFANMRLQPLLRVARLLACVSVASAQHASGQHLANGQHASELPRTSQMRHTSELPRISCHVSHADTVG